MAQEKPKSVDKKAEETEEEYRKYIVKDCTFNITVEDGGVFILQSGSPVPFPPPKP